jgi:hypothetical protein
VAHVEEAGVLLFCVWLAGRFLLLAVLSVLAGELIGGGTGFIKRKIGFRGVTFRLVAKFGG